MEQITTTSTLEKIQKLIENNDGDTGRLNHYTKQIKSI